MALGSLAPEIMLAIIEAIPTSDSTPGELGPGTIVGIVRASYAVHQLAHHTRC
jgi:hypothetical protein